MGRGVDDEVDGACSGSSSAYELFKLTRESIALRVQVETLRECLGLFGRRRSNTHSHTVSRQSRQPPPHHHTTTTMR
eukprot:COSAG01_NODE_39233_length_479_cov_0.910526_1_plen_76_part_01